MLTTLHIKNIGIIEDLVIDFNNGMNVLTGETGAGKSLIVDALNIISGGRFSKEMIRSGQNHSLVEASFYLPGNKNTEDGTLIVTREVYANGRNSCKINDRMVTVSTLREFMQNIIDIHGQNDNQTILHSINHIKYLDEFGGGKLKELKASYLELFLEYNNLTLELNKNYGNDIEKSRMLDLLNYQLNEINEANLKIGEDDELDQKRKIMQNSEKIAQNLQSSCSILDEKIISSFDDVIKHLNKIQAYNDVYANKLQLLQDIYYSVQDISIELNDMQSDVDYNLNDISKVNERLDLIYNLKRKYGSSIEEILSYKEKVEKQIDEIVNKEEYIKQLKGKLNLVTDKMYNISKELNVLRCEAAKKLENAINKQLQDLEMKNAKFLVEINFNSENKFNSNGLDTVQFMISTNIGEEYKPLTKVASGGEISRIMLAIKTIIATVESIPVIIFDEIDTGISGSAAKAVCEKVKLLSKRSQIFCITHLPVIAACADHHYYIEKKVEKNTTKTCIRLLSDKEAVEEVARISAGEVNSVSIQHALALKNIKYAFEISA